ncbi:hypothetical protein [Marinicella sp. W31]|uniref:hypothetical protein n=1 Tax=Marinicella sp. W31 TaxID=3023713 RepID=UPI003756877F
MMKCKYEQNFGESLTYAMSGADVIDSELSELLAQCGSHQRLLNNPYQRQEPSGEPHVERITNPQ